MINGKVVEQYNKHGVSVVRDCVSKDWLTVLRDAVEQDIRDPGPYVHRYESDDGQGRFHGNLRLWETNSKFRDFCLDSPLPEMAAQLLGSAKVNLLYDQLFVKEPGTRSRTRWHNDQPYWAMRGWQVLTFWVALDPVNRDSGALEFLRGSHRWNRWFQPESFGKGPTIEPYEKNPDYEPIPDIDHRFGDPLHATMHRLLSPVRENDLAGNAENPELPQSGRLECQALAACLSRPYVRPEPVNPRAVPHRPCRDL